MSTPMTNSFSEEEWRESAEGSPSFHFEKGVGAKKSSFEPDHHEAEDSELDASAREWRAAEPPPLRDEQQRQSKESRSRGFGNDARNPNHSNAGGFVDCGDPEERNWAMISHGAGAVAALFSVGVLGWAAPLVIWLTRRDESGFAAGQAKEALNFQISMLLYSLVAGLLCIILIGFPILFVLWIVNLVCSIQGAMKTHEGELYNYPWNLRLV
jgi:uncharacterized protein